MKRVYVAIGARRISMMSPWERAEFLKQAFFPAVFNEHLDLEDEARSQAAGQGIEITSLLAELEEQRQQLVLTMRSADLRDVSNGQVAFSFVLQEINTEVAQLPVVQLIATLLESSAKKVGVKMMEQGALSDFRAGFVEVVRSLDPAFRAKMAYSR